MFKIFFVFLTFFSTFYILKGQHTHYSQLKFQFDHFQQLEKFDSALIVAKQLNEQAFIYATDTSLIYAVSLRYVGDCYDNLQIADSAFIYWNKSLDILIKQNRSDGLDAALCFNNLALFFIKKYDYKTAAAYYKQELEIRKKVFGENHLEVAHILSILSELYYELGEYKAAESNWIQALEIFKKVYGENHPEVASILNSLGILYLDLGEYKISEPFLKQSLEIRKKVFGDAHSDIAQSLNNLGILYVNLGDYKTAAAYYKQELEISRKLFGDAHPDYAGSLNSLGSIYFELGDFKNAETYYKQAMMIRKNALGDAHPDYAASLNNLGDLYIDLGEYKNAETYYKQAMVIIKNTHGVAHLDYARSLNRLGNIYFKLYDFKTAETYYKQAMVIIKNARGDAHPDYAGSLNNLGNIYFELGDFKNAETYYKQAMVIKKNALGDAHLDYALSLHNLGILYGNLGVYNAAETYYKQAMVIIKNAHGDAHPDYARSLNSLGNIYFKLDDFKNAEAYYKQAMEIIKNAHGDAHPDYADILNNLGNIYSETGNFKNAELFYKQAVEIRKIALGDAHPDYAGSLNNLGILYRNSRNYKSAEPLIKKALQLYTAIYGRENPNVELILSNLGILYSYMGEYKIAEEYYNESFKIKLENINSGFSWLSAQEKIVFWNQENRFFLDLGHFSYKAWKDLNSATELTYNASLVSKSLLLETSRELDQAFTKSSDEVMKNQFKEMKQLLKFYNKIQSEGSANKETALNYKRQADSLDKILVNKLGVYADSKRKFKITWKDVQSNLGSTEAAIEFVRFYKDSLYNYMALVVRPEYEYPKLVKLGDELAIQAAVQSKDYASLYNLAWKGIDSLLEGVQRVYYSPSGELNNVSFSAICLQSGNDLVISSQNANRGMIIGSKITTKTDCKTVLMDKYELHQLTSTRYLADGTLQKEKTVQQSLVILGGVNYDEKPEQTSKEEKEQSNEDYALMNNLNLMVNRNSANYGKRMEYLSGTKEEVIIIENLLNNSKWKVQARSDKSAGEYEFKKEMESKGPGVLHIATHGFAFPEEIKKEGKMMELNQTSTYKIAEDPMLRCGLMLSGSNISWTGNPKRMIEQTGDDGILTAAEVANMDLSNTKLVVLSACETGLGKIEGSEGTFGLKRGFKLAGVEQIIVSLWSVPDKETMELMTLFYSDLTQSLNPVSSFERAQKEMRLKYPTDPEKWAGFVLVR